MIAHPFDNVPRDFFDDVAPVYVAHAPGRLDVMGGIADYSGSLVLQLPLDRHTTAMLQPTTGTGIEIVSLRAEGGERLQTDIGALLHGELRTAEGLASHFSKHDANHWGAYVLGVIHECLHRHARASKEPLRGFRLLIQSDVPEGKGVSSSAALEVSCLAAVAAHFQVPLSAEEIAIASQWAENHIAGAPCGIMDQMTSACGRRDHLLRLRCQPASIEGFVEIPAGYRFYGIDSGIRHAVTGADYGTVRTAAFMGYRMIAAAEGLPAEQLGHRVQISDDRWHGYLANITPSEFEERFARQLPERMSGEEFLRDFGGITDAVTQVDSARTYPVRQATAHPVYENARVERFAALLEQLEHDASAADEMGRLMYESHASYSACGLGSDGTDRLVQMVCDEGSLFGAKITGGGSGGTVAILGTEDSEAAVYSIAGRYAAESGRVAEVFTGSGAGMEEIGVFVRSANG